MLSKNTTVDEEAENLTLQRLLSGYLAPGENALWTIEDACITARQTANRLGVPADAQTWLYRVQHPDLGWTVDLRAVWRCGRLMRPCGTHTAVVGVWDDDDQYGNPAATRDAFREWLRALPL
jgi:hypothetical protein